MAENWFPNMVLKKGLPQTMAENLFPNMVLKKSLKKGLLPQTMAENWFPNMVLKKACCLRQWQKIGFPTWCQKRTAAPDNGRKLVSQHGLQKGLLPPTMAENWFPNMVLKKGQPQTMAENCFPTWYKKGAASNNGRKLVRQHGLKKRAASNNGRK